MSNPTAAKEKATRGVDKTLPTLMFLLMLMGLVTLLSATYYTAQAGGDALREVKEQLLGVAVGLAAMALMLRMPLSVLYKPSVVMTALITSLILLLLVLIPGIGRSINGSRRWIALGSLTFQPSELAKYACVLFMARTLSARGALIRSMVKGILPLLIAPGLMFLLILEQPNLSTAGTIVIVSVLMVLMAGARWRDLTVLFATGAALGGYYAWSEPYRRERLLSFMDPFAKMSDEGYQLSQSLIAFGSGGLFGMGLGQGRQKYAFLPYPESDFIFAIVGEDFGLLGCCVVAALFAAFYASGMRIAMRCPDKFGSLLAAGIVTMIAVQAFINMGVVVGLLPTTGLPLPFFSSGGTSLSITMAMVGVVLNISRTCEA